MRRQPFAEKVARGLRERGLSLRALCREARLDASFLSKVLSGKRSPPSDEAVLRKVAAALSLDPIAVIVSTGRIPSQWQPMFQDPAVLNALARMVAASPAAAAEPASRRRGEGRDRSPGPAPARPFSDELL